MDSATQNQQQKLKLGNWTAEVQTEFRFEPLFLVSCKDTIQIKCKKHIGREGDLWSIEFVSTYFYIYK